MASPTEDDARPTEPAFVFDLDGVLVDTAELVTHSWLRYAADRGHELTRAEVRDRLFGRRTVDILHDEFGVPVAEAEAMVAAGFDDKTDAVAAGPGLVEVPGARAFARAAVAGGWSVALVSSASAANIDLALRSIGLDDAFPIVIDASRVARGKPAPDPYLAAAAALGRPGAGMVVFEDSIAGIEAALRAGARCVGVASYQPRARLATANLVVDDLSGWTPAMVLGALDGGSPQP